MMPLATSGNRGDIRISASSVLQRKPAPLRGVAATVPMATEPLPKLTSSLGKTSQMFLFHIISSMEMNNFTVFM